MFSLLLSFYIAASPSIAGSAAEAMNFIKEDIKPVIQFSMDWAARCALAATSTHAFIVVCKRFLD
ncbi:MULTISPECIES: hypothetical protein [unclassified Microcoleus]|uniref:hypothetical protein n=1 Tax=unclassified Microcoleus TaxID=2642155 RepID=UPI002FD0E172